MAVKISPIQCCICYENFPTPKELDVMMLICCNNISHISCATNWSKQQKNCMRCREVMDLTHAGKSFDVLWRTLEIAMNQHPEDIQQFFADPQKLDSPDTECASCREDFALLGIDYISEKDSFAHKKCGTSAASVTVHLSHLAALTQTLMEKHSRLKEALLAH